VSEAKKLADAAREALGEEIARLGPQKFNFGFQAILQSKQWLRPGRYTFEVVYAADEEERHTTSLTFSELDCEIVNRMHAEATGQTI
jgi:hypothetical protein